MGKVRTMGINIRVINEQGEVIEDTDIVCPIGSNYIAKEGLADSVKLLSYVDEYGDTFFNRLQFEDLRKDCEIVKQTSNSKRINLAMDQLISLIDKWKNDVHIFIKFFGD